MSYFSLLIFIFFIAYSSRLPRVESRQYFVLKEISVKKKALLFYMPKVCLKSKRAYIYLNIILFFLT